MRFGSRPPTNALPAATLDHVAQKFGFDQKNEGAETGNGLAGTPPAFELTSQMNMHSISVVKRKERDFWYCRRHYWLHPFHVSRP